LLNETNWNKFDDVFYVIPRRWFDRWKDYVAYDYIVKTLVSKDQEINLKRVMANNSNPNEINNHQLILDRKEHLQLRNPTEKLKYLNNPMKAGL
jgi:hypothetical protein